MPFDPSKPLIPTKVVKPTESSALDKAAAFTLGAVDAANPLPLIKTGEVLTRAALKGEPLVKMQPDVPQEFVPPSFRSVPKSFSERIAEASQEAFMPEMSVEQIMGLIPGVKEKLDELPKSWKKAGGLASMLYGGFQGAKGMIKGSPVKQASKASESAISDVKYLTGEAEGPVLNAMVNSPSEVKSLLNSGKLSVNDISKSLLTALQKKRKVLGESVEGFRTVALNDTKPSINVSPTLQRLNRIEAEMKTSGGKSVLESGDLDALDKVRSLLPAQTTKGGAIITPRDAILVSDELFRISQRASVKPGLIAEKVAFELREARREIKEAARQSTGSAQAWGEADNVFSEFVDSSDSVVRKLESEGAVSFVDSLLNKNKEPIQEQLAKALDIGNKNARASKEFTKKLATVKASQGMKALDVTKADPIRDQANRLFQHWVNRGKDLGEAAGSTAIGGLGVTLGLPSGGIAAGGAGVGGAFIGSKIGKYAGGLAGAVAGRKYASPQHLLSKLENAKTLSKEAKEFLKDLGWVQKNFGVEGANIFWNSLKGIVPAAREVGGYLGAT